MHPPEPAARWGSSENPFVRLGPSHLEGSTRFHRLEVVMSIKRIEPGPRMSRAVVHGDTVYLPGVVAGKPDTGVAEQTQQILAEIERLLTLAGSSKSKILSATIWLADIATFAEMNGVW